MAEYTGDPNLNGWISSVNSDYTEDILRSLGQTTGPYELPEDCGKDDFQLQAWDLVNETMSSSVANCFSVADSSEIIDIALPCNTVDTYNSSSSSNSILTRSVNDSDSDCDTKSCRSVNKEYCFKRSESQMLISDDAISTLVGLPQSAGTFRKCEKRPCVTEQSGHLLPRQRVETMHSKTARLSSEKTKHGTRCMTQNAINARQNRMKKKQYELNLENTVEQLKNENAELQKKYDEQMEVVQNLSTQVEYLNKVVANADKLGLLLQNIPTYLSGSSNVQGLSNNAHTTKKLASTCEFDFEKLERRYLDMNQDGRNAVGFDHNYACLQSRDANSEAGVCLHVATNGLAVEMCAICSQSAQKTFNHLRNSR